MNTWYNVIKHYLITTFFHTVKTTHDNIVPQLPWYLPISVNLYWSNVISCIKSNELLLKGLVVLYAIIILVPLVYLLGKYVLLRIGKRVWNSNFTIFSHGNYVRLQLPEVFKDTVDVADWIAQFELYCKANRVTNDRLKKEILLSRMNKENRELIKSRLAENETYVKTVRLIETLFAPHEPTIMHHVRNFSERKQLVSENVQKFYTELRRLAKLAWPKTSKDNLEEYISSQFVSGLKETPLKEKLLMDKKENIKLEELITLAERLEKNLSQGSDTVEIKNMQIVKSENNNSNTQTPNSSFNNTNNANNNNSLNNQNSNNNTNQNSSNYNNNNYNNVKCYNCGRSGHFVKDCKFPKTGRPGSSGNQMH